MKKIILTIAALMIISFSANAQSDGFFRTNNFDYFDYRNGIGIGDEIGFALPAGHGYDYDTNSPLGSGLLILTALGVGYAVNKKKK
jgi:Protein of unknown function (DUF680).